MASITSALNELLATNFSDVKATYVQPQQQQGQQQIAQTEETEQEGYEKQQQQNSQRSNYFQYADAKRQSLQDIGSPQIELSPSDQIELFAEGTAEPRLNAKLSVAAPGEVEDEHAIIDHEGTTNGVGISQSIGNEGIAAQSLQQKAQAAAGALYARNYNIIYHVTPAISEAA